jgi:hypothetical protein
MRSMVERLIAAVTVQQNERLKQRPQYTAKKLFVRARPVRPTLSPVSLCLFQPHAYANCEACMDRATISNCISVVPDADKPPSASLSAAA